ncbi:hypothetical protein CK203_099356 [Vitis vinifera]|uniref:Uncharacterized protein n=1 Tax=Vitis vinifera TaxID=29760 RepID=A0A438CHR5_VITVI|nr:hypothetical protein CK203_099356 [Vitis vinifera]
MTTRGVLSPTSIHFTIDGHHGILKARDIVEALQIPFKPVDPSTFYQWSSVSQRHGPHFIQGDLYRFDPSSKGASTWDAPYKCGATLQPLSLTAFGTEVMSYLGCFVSHIKGLLLWPIPLDHGLLVHFKEMVHRKKLQRAEDHSISIPEVALPDLEAYGFSY